MKKIKIILAALLTALLILSESCNVKKDCRGKTKHRLPNGIWI